MEPIVSDKLDGKGVITNAKVKTIDALFYASVRSTWSNFSHIKRLPGLSPAVDTTWASGVNEEYSLQRHPCSMPLASITISSSIAMSVLELGQDQGNRADETWISESETPGREVTSHTMLSVRGGAVLMAIVLKQTLTNPASQLRINR